MAAYNLSNDCIPGAVAKEKMKGQFECFFQGACESKFYRGFHTYCRQSPMYENITFADKKKGAPGEKNPK